MSSKGKKNAYVCDTCSKHIVTVDKDDGVTPFMVSCKITDKCDGWMHSKFYPPAAQAMEATWEWVFRKKDEPLRLRRIAN